MRKYVWFLCAGLVLAAASSSFALDPILIGNFEDPAGGNGRYDNWMSDFNETIPVTTPVIVVTRGNKALKLVDTNGSDGATFSKPFGEYGGTLEENIYYQALLNPGAVIAFDVTAISGQVADGWASIRLFWNSAGGWGQDYGQELAVAVDGLPHTYVFSMTEEATTALEGSIGGWGYNLGFILNTGSGSTTLYVDNIWIFPEGLTNLFGPYSPSIEQTFNINPEYVDLSLHWKAGADPNDDFIVNPAIVDEYVFMTNGSDTDPNLYYLGNTGEDPGLTDPNSQYPPTGTLLRPINSTYKWAVVEALDGFQQTLTAGVDTLNDADPNNIIGPIWSFNTLSTIPVITVQPVSTKFLIGGSNPTFTISVDSITEESYQWYYSLDAVRDPENDVPINTSTGGNTDTITIPSANKAYQAYYYCKVWNAATSTGGGSEDDVYSNVVTLVVERKIAEYLFDGNLNDTSTTGNNGVGINSPGFAAGVNGGSALSLNGIDQYVDLDPNGFPRASLLDVGGIGGGLDIGSIMCWVKLDTAPSAGSAAAILSNQNPGWPVTWFQFAIESDGTNTNIQSFVWGDADNGAVFWQSWRPTWADTFNIAGDDQWHMLAVTWDMNGIMQTYVDGSLIATTGTGVANTFSMWTNGTLIGAAHADGGAGSYFDGLIDNLRVYNYILTPETIAQEYYDITGNPGCIYFNFEGSAFNVDNTGTSYCRVDIADLAGFAAGWLADGFYP